MVKKISQLYLETKQALLSSEVPHDAAFLAKQLLAFTTNKTQAQLLTNWDSYVTDTVCQTAEDAVSRVLNGEPLAYILGQWEFYGLTLAVTPDVLIPRDDTCAVTELALKWGRGVSRILDLCTGSGCIGLALASKLKESRVILGDISKDALAVARKNAALNQLSGRVSCMQVNALETAPALLGKFDLIISNPPYITGEEMKTLPKSVADFEPHLALYGGEDGLDFYRSIIDHFTIALNPNGLLALEFGMGQGDDVCQLLQAKGYTILERSRDYNDRERAVIAQYVRKES